MNYREDIEIVATFVNETRDHLDDMEHGVLLLEKHPGNMDLELVHTLFRAAHSIKAGANLLEFHNIETIAHGLEEILQKIRLGICHMSGELVSLLLVSIDQINELVDTIQSSDRITIEPLLKRLNSHTD